jgi:hypothetical protein
LEKEFTVDPTYFQTIPSYSCIFLDDYVFDPRTQVITDFNKVINYNLRHNNIILFLICHNLIRGHLHTEILNAPHLFFAYSNVGNSIMR